MAAPPDSLPPEVLAAFRRRQPLEAIRLLLSQRAQSQPPARSSPAPTPSSSPTPAARPGLSPGEVPRSGSSFWGWLIAALFAYLAYRLLRG
jgi:hypothetical protein